MGYILLTGATGLLGAYLLRDLLGAGFHVAVVTRRSRLATPEQRIEEIMRRWESQAGYTWPRPVIFAGDLTHAHLGLDKAAVDWIGQHCDTLLHNGASVSFAQDRYGDPWRSNVEGVEHVLELCHETGIRNYHHVSTAYVCGLRQGLIAEHDLDLGQDFSNDYERSKIAGEKLIRKDGFIEPPTVYRPSIIIGDSQTGYTTTFHGFYAPLRLGHAMFKRIIREEVDIDPLQEALQLTGNERKHLVPVDWVSRLITHILLHPEHCGKTYHLVPGEPVTVEVMREAMVRAFLSYGDANARSEGASMNWKEFTGYFTEKMKIYEAYWRDDPEFDRSNTEKAAPHLPCPAVHVEMLLQACRYALKSNFGWPRPALPELDLDITRQLRAVLSAAASEPQSLALNLRVNGPGGGQWHLGIRENRPVSLDLGCLSDSAGTLYCNTLTWTRLINREIAVEEAVRTGCLVLEAREVTPSDLQETMEAIVARSAPPVSSSRREQTSV